MSFLSRWHREYALLGCCLSLINIYSLHISFYIDWLEFVPLFLPCRRYIFINMIIYCLSHAFSLSAAPSSAFIIFPSPSSFSHMTLFSFWHYHEIHIEAWRGATAIAAIFSFWLSLGLVFLHCLSLYLEMIVYYDSLDYRDRWRIDWDYRHTCLCWHCFILHIFSSFSLLLHRAGWLTYIHMFSLLPDAAIHATMPPLPPPRQQVCVHVQCVCKSAASLLPLLPNHILLPLPFTVIRGAFSSLLFIG